MCLKQLNFKIALLFIILSSFFSFHLVFAQQQTVIESYTACVPECCASEKVSAAKCPNIDCDEYCGNNTLNSALLLVVKIIGMILSVVGSLALLAFVYGGIVFLTSAGSRERVEKGRQIIIGAVIGVVIVFASYTIIGFVFKLFGITVPWNSINWF